jgi:hypothetical protein
MSNDLRLFQNGKTYFLEFECEDEEKAMQLLGQIFRPDRGPARTELEAKFGIVTKSIGWVNWKQKCEELKESMDRALKGFL